MSVAKSTWGEYSAQVLREMATIAKEIAEVTELLSQSSLSNVLKLSGSES